MKRTPPGGKATARSRRKPHPHPEIFCDFNAQMTDRGYSLERAGSIADLARLGLTLADAVGRRFTFNGGDDGAEGEEDDILCNGVVIHDPAWGYLAFADEDGIYWRSEVDMPTDDCRGV